ncbi:MAG: tRNA (N(6)-L-threonylcarbamoyladenosine(37)-C(2))-methylthiotransferase MtaB [Omnitrophica WOR_2 bacterium RIFCSPHIGHO2_02_FULL_48_11]|nr:MAG: tRNA (N(6)-L-threonylcarbamoyladenosine(37)-C(2))-methylthiotransferase MtaB [Omnitrophica WOR_2 bacterium RIFCSPHIGHO2_02_FULL_48_11]
MIKQSSKKRISFYTFGCRLNQAETAVIKNSFQAGNYQVVDFAEPADVVVVNTCTVTENGDADTRKLVSKINRLNPRARIALIGCQAQIQKEKLAKLANVYWIVGNAKKFDLAEILQELDSVSTPQVIAPAIPREAFTIPVAGIDTDHTRANIKIQDGCDFFCSFCEIPYARGRARSREFQNILEEARLLAAAGHREIVLTGINLGTYANAEKNILQVIEELEKIEQLDRIRISSIEPTTIPRELIQRMAGPSKLCRYLHIPLQSGEDQILKRMARKYTVKEFTDFMEYAKQTVPEICIGTDVIVGFPGETDEHFAATCELLRILPLDYFHVFSYSKRSLAQSRSLTGTVPQKIIERRSQILRELSQRKRRVFYETQLGTTQNVLFENQKNSYWFGLTDHYIRVKVRSPENLTNQLRTTRFERIDGQTVLGTLNG